MIKTESATANVAGHAFPVEIGMQLEKALASFVIPTIHFTPFRPGMRTRLRELFGEAINDLLDDPPRGAVGIVNIHGAQRRRVL